MIQAVDPLKTPFLRFKATHWKRKHLDPLPPIEQEVMGMISRVLVFGWGPSDRLKGLRISVPVSPSKMTRHGGKRSVRKYRSAISSLIGKGFLEVTGTGSRGIRFVRPSILWKTRGQGPSQGPSQVFSKSFSTKGLNPVQNRTGGRLVRTEVAKQPSAISRLPKSSKPSPIRFKTGTSTKAKDEFLGLVRVCFKSAGSHAYAVANDQIKNHRLDFLLPIWREATSPTAGIQTPLAWVKSVVRKRSR